MKSAKPLTFLLTISLVSLTSICRAEDENAQARILKAIDGYGQAWKEADAEKRANLIGQVWAQDGLFKDPSVTLRGAEALSLHIGKFVRDFPGARLLPTSKIDSYGTAFHFSWSLILADGTLAVEGFDYGELDGDGRIRSIVGFWGRLPNEEARNNEAIVANYMDSLFQKFDLAELDKIISKDAAYTQAVGLPYGGTYSGLPEMVKMFTKAQSYYSLQVIDGPVFYTNPTNKKVLVSFTIKCASKKTEKQITMAIIETFELKDGKIVGITPYYFDTKTFVEFLGDEAKKG